MDMDMDTDTRMSSPTKKRTFPNDLSISTTKGSRSSRRRCLSVCTSHTSKTSSSFDRLTDDLLTEILLRVPIKPLHRSKCVSKVFSSTDEAAEWSIFHVPCPPGSRWIFGTTKLVFLNGKFHWCGTNCIAAFDPFNKPLHCDIIPLPLMDPLELESRRILFLEVCQGHLRLVRVFPNKKFMVWDLVDYANKVWVQKLDVNTDLLFQSFVGVAARDKVYMLDYPSTVKLFDVRNNSLQHVYDPINLDNVDKLRFAQPFLSSPWPTPVAVQQKKLLSYIHFS